MIVDLYFQFDFFPVSEEHRDTHCHSFHFREDGNIFVYEEEESAREFPILFFSTQKPFNRI